MKQLKVSKTASKGVVMGKVYVVTNPDLTPMDYMVSDIQEEIEKYKESVIYVTDRLRALAEKNEIFAAHLELVNDQALLDGIVDKITSDGKNVEQALADVTEEFAMIFEMMDDEYMRERAADIKDVSARMMLRIKGIGESDFSDITEQVILVAQDLVPSQTANLDLDYVLGFLTEQGGVTSHVSIMARNVGLPALVGVSGLLSEVSNGDYIAMNASTGDIVINPDEATICQYEMMLEAFLENERRLNEFAHLNAETQDGKKVKICANVGSIEDVECAMKAYVDGVGLFRSEFLYMENTKFPTEEEQFQVYKKAVELCDEEVIIRTLDIGGDKGLPYYTFEEEENPFLGFRAIRISLQLEDVFRNQLRALLRASAYGKIKIMYPMIISMEELICANQILATCKKELESESLAYNKDIKVGMMIETPASVMSVEAFAKHVDFFSIGTNDLTQYLLAVDRGNQKIADMYNSFHPAVLHAISRVIKAGHKEQIEVGMCGEFASDERAAKLLLGMGLDEYSVSASEVANIKNTIRNANYESCKTMAQRVEDIYTIEEVMEIIGA